MTERRRRRRSGAPSLSWLLLVALAALPPDGDAARAQSAPPVIDPVAAPETPPEPPPIATGDCEALMPQVLTELEFWRTRELPPATAPATDTLLPAPSVPLDRPRIAQVAAAVKEMKADQAARIFAGWDDALATEVLARLPARASGAITAALEPAHAARLLARLSLLATEEETP